MGMSADAILAYGYDLGSPRDGSWLVQEADEYGGLTVDWLNEDDDVDYAEAIENRLLAELAGFTETWTPESKDFYPRRQEAKAAVGVEVIFYGYEFDGIALSVKQFEASGYTSKIVNPKDLAVQPYWNVRLANAVSALGITPNEKPGWLLLPRYG